MSRKITNLVKNLTPFFTIHYHCKPFFSFTTCFVKLNCTHFFMFLHANRIGCFCFLWVSADSTISSPPLATRTASSISACSLSFTAVSVSPSRLTATLWYAPHTLVSKHRAPTWQQYSLVLQQGRDSF